MAEAIAVVLKIALGFVSDKVRTYGADKLQDGGLTDQKFRGWIVRELDDVKFKLDALSRMHLSASVSAFEQGVKHLLMCFEDSFDSGNESQSSELLKDGKSSAESKSLTSVGDAVALVNVFRKLKIESKKRFESAKGLFVESATGARLSFHNDALKTNERIHAAEVRIASAILGNLDDLEIAGSDCLHFLNELHNMTAIKEIFTVHIKGGVKALFKKDSRAEIVGTLTMINLILADFITKFTKRRMGLFDWPTIKCGDDVFHPICNDESLEKMERMEISVPWEISCSETLPWNYRLAIDSKGEIYGFDIEKKDNMVKFDRAAGEWKPFNISPSNDEVRNCIALTIDDEDMMYILSSSGTLSVYSPDGKIVHQRHLDGLRNDFRWFRLHMTVTKDKKIIIFSYDEYWKETATVYIWESWNGKLARSFRKSHDDEIDNFFPIDDEIENCFSLHDEIDNFFPFDDEITVAAVAKELCFHKSRQLCTYSQEGEFKRTVKLSPIHSLALTTSAITFDHVTNNYVVISDNLLKTNVEYFSKTGKSFNNFAISSGIKPWIDQYFPLSHSNGAMAVVDTRNDKVLYLRLPKM